MTARAIRRTSVGVYLYLVIGILFVHLLHLARFRLAGWDSISAFPDWTIFLVDSLQLSPVLLVTLLLFGGIALWRLDTPAVTASFILVELVSQTLGRSLFKLAADAGVWFIVVAGIALSRRYGAWAASQLDRRQLSLFHSEALAVTRAALTVCLFVIGTLGIAVTSNLISRYFDTELGQSTAWVHVGTMMYLSLGMVAIVVAPLYGGVVRARERSTEHPDMDKPNSPPTVNTPAHLEGHVFDALKLRFEDQTTLLRKMTDIDIRILSAFVTVQLLFASWLATGPIPRGDWFGGFSGTRVALLVVDLVVLGAVVLSQVRQRQRRKEVIKTIHNLNDALGYNEMNALVEGHRINDETKGRHFTLAYFLIDIAAFGAVVLVMWVK